MHLRHILRAAWQRADFWPRFIGLLLFAVGLSTFAATTQSVDISTRSAISEHWRGTYDLLVRPPQAVSAWERETGLVEGNYLGTPRGGITLEQYRLIAGMSSVEVAAPVATVGYLLNDTGSVTFKLPPPQPNTLYHLRVRLSGPHTEFNREWETFWAALSRTGEVAFLGEQPDSLINGKFLQFGLGNLPRQWTLLAGIDPVQEARLVNLPATLTQGEYLPEEPGMKQVYDGDNLLPAVPLLVSRNAFLGDAKLLVQGESITVDNEYLQDATLSDVQERIQMAHRTLWLTQTLSLEGNLSPLSGNAILFSPNEEPKIGEEGMFTAVDKGTLLYPGEISYTPLDVLPSGAEYRSGFKTFPLGRWGDIVEPALRQVRQTTVDDAYWKNLVSVLPETLVFRPLDVRSLPPFTFQVRGRYDFASLAAPQDPLVYTPLGIYEPPAGVVRYDENGTPLPEQIYYPDLNPGGFLPRPPLALTTLDAAQYLSGRDDFIDAIRVRLSGIEAYTPENLAKVERVAAEIAERTGLHVDIVAGSSPQKVLVQVPDLGYVEEQWTTLGAAVQVSGGITAANVVLLGVFLLAAVLFMAEISQVSLLGRYPEIGMLRATGWSTTHILSYLLSDVLLMGAFAGGVSVLASLALNTALGLHITGGILGGVFLIGVGACLLGAFFPAWRVTLRWPVELLRRGEMSLPAPSDGKVPPLHLVGLAWRQVWGRRTRFLLTACIVAFGISLNIFVLGALLALRGRLEVTLLGTFVSLHLRSYHVLMALVVLAMSFLAVSGNLLLSVTERSQEFALLRALGWPLRSLRRLVMSEAVLSVLAGGVPGALGGAGLLALAVRDVRLLWESWALVGILLSIGLALLSAWYPVRMLSRLMPAQVLSADGRRIEPLMPSHSRSPALVLSVLLSVLLLGVVLGGRKDVARHAVGLDLTPTPTLPPAQEAVALDEAMHYAAELVDLGPRSAFYPQAQTAAAEYIADALRSEGWQVTRQAVPLRALDIFAAGTDSAALRLPDDMFFLGALAMHFSQLQPGGQVRAPLLWVSDVTSPPEADLLAGKIVLLLDTSGTARPGDLLRTFLQSGVDASRPVAVVEVLGDTEGNSLADVLSALDAPEGVLYLSQNVVASLGEGASPVWLAAGYISSEDSPGAGEASGSAALLVWAHDLAKHPPSRAIKLLFLGGANSGLEGLLRFLHSPAETPPSAALYFGALGSQEPLSYASRLDAPDALEMLGGAEEIAYQREAGQATLLNFWTSILDLDTPDPAGWLADWEAKDAFGLPETPDFLVEIARRSATASDVQVEARFLADCSPDLFLFSGYPALAVCSAGDTRLRTSYDTLGQLDRLAYRRSLAFGYQLLHDVLESELP